MKTNLRGSRAQSMVEFAVLAPIFFLLLFGTIDLGRAIYIYNSISDAAREGARAAIPREVAGFATPGSVVPTAVNSKLGGGFVLTVDPSSGTSTDPATADVPTTPNTGEVWYSSGIGVGYHRTITVKVTYFFQPWVPLVSQAAGNNIMLTAISTMQTEY
jgi:Flp pilus assembly protein TadG